MTAAGVCTHLLRSLLNRLGRASFGQRLLAPMLFAAAIATLLAFVPPYAAQPDRFLPNAPAAEAFGDAPGHGVTAGTLVERPFYSAILNRELPYLMYLPPGAETSGERYPVLYFLHGLGADYRQWFDLGVVRAADQLIAEKVIPPMIIVMPNGENGYWMNHRPDGPRWRDYLITEFIPFVEQTAPIDARRDARAIGGLSAGGHGALILGWSNPRLFSVAGAHSPGLRGEKEAFPFFGQGEEYSKRDPLTQARLIRDVDLDLWIDTGDNDPWRQRAEALHATLTERKIAHVWRHSAGGHDGIYWAANVKEYLRFYGMALAKRQQMANAACTLGLANGVTP